jgi:general secretion pathway protein B
MSYILDALRRADAEREQGASPGLHTPVAPRMAADAPGRSTAGNPLVWIIIGLSVVLVGALVWISMRSSEPVAVGEPVLPAPVVAAAPPQMTAPAAAAPPVAEVPAAPARAPEALAEPPHAKPPAPPPVARPVPAKAAAPAPAPAAASPVEPRVMTLAELPDSVRREIPELTFGGAMYSEKKASRMLIVNGQLLHEGDKAAPGVTLEQIRLKSAVFEYKGTRYSMSY